MKPLLKNSLLLFAIAFSANLCAQGVALNNHFDIIQQLSTTKSKSRQLVLEARKNMSGAKLDSMKLKYFDLKSSGDGVISRYKSMIDNPKMAQKSGESVTKQMNEMVSYLNSMTNFYSANIKTMGFAPVAALALVPSIMGLGKDVYSEIKNAQKTKRDEMKAELDQYVLADWDEVK